MSNPMPSNAWDELTYQFPKFNGCTVKVWEWISNFIPHFVMDAICLPVLGLKLNHVSKRDPWYDETPLEYLISTFMVKSLSYTPLQRPRNNPALVDGTTMDEVQKSASCGSTFRVSCNLLHSDVVSKLMSYWKKDITQCVRVDKTGDIEMYFPSDGWIM